MNATLPTANAIPWGSLGPVIGVFAIWVIGLVAFTIRTAVKGRYRIDRVEQMGGTRILSAWLMEYGYWMIHGLCNLLVRLGVRPNTITFLSLVLSIASAAFLFLGWFGLGGWLMIASAIFDLFDGMVARQTGVASEAGEYFDSVIDRYCELFTFIALMGYYFAFAPWVAWIVGLALIASLMITFTRAKGEAQGVTGVPSGLMRRHERLIYIGVGTAASPILAAWLEPGVAHPIFHLALAAFAFVALLGNITAIRLALQVHRRLRERQAGEGTPPGRLPSSAPERAGGMGHGEREGGAAASLSEGAAGRMSGAREGATGNLAGGLEQESSRVTN